MSTRTRAGAIITHSLSIALALSACGGSIDAGRRGSRPPGATVSVRDQQQRIEPISSCWGGLCVDGLLIADRADALPVAGHDVLKLRTSALAIANNVSASVRSLAPASAVRPVAIQWDSHRATVAVSAMNLAPGRSQIDILMQVEGGDVGYSFVVAFR